LPFRVFIPLLGLGACIRRQMSACPLDAIGSGQRLGSIAFLSHLTLGFFRARARLSVLTLSLAIFVHVAPFCWREQHNGVQGQVFRYVSVRR
jgi:hypothetical protein